MQRSWGYSWCNKQIITDHDSSKVCKILRRPLFHHRESVLRNCHAKIRVCLCCLHTRCSSRRTSFLVQSILTSERRYQTKATQVSNCTSQSGRVQTRFHPQKTRTGRREPAEMRPVSRFTLFAICLLLVSCLAYYSTLKTESICSSEMRLTQTFVLFVTALIYCSSLDGSTVNWRFSSMSLSLHLFSRNEGERLQPCNTDP
jgi:hypothetical protein